MSFRLPLLLLLAIIPLLGARITVSESDLIEAEVTVGGDPVTVFCYLGLPGKVRNRADELQFISYRTLFHRFRKRFRATGKRKHRVKKRRNRVLWRDGVVACSQESEGGDGTEEPQQPENGNGAETSYFDSFGNVTALGLSVFEIPAGLEANAFTGQEVYNQYCIGCHEKRVRPTFTILRATISQEPMFYTEEFLPDQLLAHLTAYFQVGRSPLRE